MLARANSPNGRKNHNYDDTKANISTNTEPTQVKTSNHGNTTE